MTETPYPLLESIHNILQASATAYSNYLQRGRIYRDACELKRLNTSLHDLLTKENNLLSKDLQNDGLALIAHYDAWTEKWNALEQELKPAPGDTFAFENEHRFPREAANNLEKEYHRLKETR